MSPASTQGDVQGGSSRQRRNPNRTRSPIGGPVRAGFRKTSPSDITTITDHTSEVRGHIVPESLKIFAPSGEPWGWDDGPDNGTFCFKVMPDKMADSWIEPAAIDIIGDKVKEAVQRHGRQAFAGGVGITLVYRGGGNIVDSVWLRVDDETEEDEGDDSE